LSLAEQAIGNVKHNQSTWLLFVSSASSTRIPAWCIVKFGHLLGASYDIQGLENIDRSKGGVVLINHQSAIDLIGESCRSRGALSAQVSSVVLGKLWPVIGKATQVAKKEIFYLFPFGLACYLWGTLFINRQNKALARSAMNRESRAINERQVRKSIESATESQISLLSLCFDCSRNY
jgi:lysophosphatidate acyltransferase